MVQDLFVASLYQPTQSYYYQGDNMTMDREIMTAVIRINQFQQNPYNDGSNFLVNEALGKLLCHNILSG